MNNQINITITIDQDTPFCQEQSLLIPDNSTIADALSLWQQQHPIDNLNQRKVGVFGAPKTSDYILHAGDRLEVYMPLKIDPKQARRIRAEKAKNKQA